tara:strand:+ start:5907 stop:6869 length:963 start_codon:yes stop_codon:yes gene_type:complete
MPSREELQSHPVTTLKKEISKTNIKGYSKMKKPEIVELMLKNKSRFHHIKMAEKKTKKEKPKEDKPKPKLTSTSASGKVNQLKPKPKAKAKAKEEKPLLDLSKLKIKENTLNYINNNVEIIASLLDNEFYLDIFTSQSDEDEPRAPRGEANMVLCEIIKHLLKDKSKYGLDKKSKFTLEAGEIEGTKNFNQQKLNKYYMTLGFKKDKKESDETESTIFSQPISGFIKNCMKFDKDVLSGKKPKPKLPDIDKIENTIIDEIKSGVVKRGYDDAIDIYDLLDLRDFKKPQRERALKIIQKIIKTTKTETRFPEADVKKRLKL